MAHVALFHVSPEFKRPSEHLVLEDNLLHVVMFSLLAQMCTCVNVHKKIPIWQTRL